MASAATTTQTRTTPEKLVLNVPPADIKAQMAKDGFTVIPSVLSREKAAHYADQAYSWVEKFGCGFDRNDPATHTADKLHYFVKGGLTNKYGVAHEQWMWDLKSEPAIVDVFADIWGTNELLASFGKSDVIVLTSQAYVSDGCNISIPLKERLPDDEVFKPWAHVDQSPLHTELYCVQGIMNLLPNGPDDGGLMVLKGSSALYAQMFEAFDDVKPPQGWNTIDRHDHTPEQLQWLVDRGCQWEKVCAQPGDLLLWDSRTAHYGATPSADADRVAVYCCYKPASLATDEVKAIRKDAWERKLNTSHDPISMILGRRDVPSDHHTAHMDIPLQDPVLSPLGRKLVGVDAY